jgi:pimeloyl-ACP methyl ester carboxylesterase
MSEQTSVTLVHGAWADGSCWSKVILLLQAKGITVTAAQIPLTSLADDIAVTKRLISMQKAPTVLVGHSYGGAVIGGAAVGMPQVKALVYLTAFGLDEGESLDSLSKQGPPPAGAAAVEPDEFGYLWINRKKFHQAFAADATADEAAVMAAVQRPLSVAGFTDQAGAPAWKHLPSWYLVCTNDQMIPPPAQQLLAARMHATQKSVPSSHAPFVSHPQAVAEIIIEAVAEISG